MKLTAWFSGAHRKPDIPGVYQGRTGTLYAQIGYQRWDGSQWFKLCSTAELAQQSDTPEHELFQNCEWRGLAEDPTMTQTEANNTLHAFLAAMKEDGMDPADLVAAMADLAPVRERILATAVTPPTVPELIPIAKRKLADLIAAGHVVNGLAFERLNPDGTSTRGAVTVGGMVLWWHPEQQSALYEELRAAIDAGSETATHADALRWVQGAHHVLADVHGLTLTDEQCDAFRRLPMPFNDMVRAIHAAGAEHRTEPAAPCWCATCRPVTPSDMRMVTCPQCGNKRCPRANDHRNACTGSNEPGQPGSAYP